MYFKELLKLGCVEDMIMYLPRQQWSMFFFLYSFKMMMRIVDTKKGESLCTGEKKGMHRFAALSHTTLSITHMYAHTNLGPIQLTFCDQVRLKDLADAQFLRYSISIK